MGRSGTTGKFSARSASEFAIGPGRAVLEKETGRRLEAASGFEPLNKGFAESHAATTKQDQTLTITTRYAKHRRADHYQPLPNLHHQNGRQTGGRLFAEATPSVTHLRGGNQVRLPRCGRLRLSFLE